MVFDKANLKNFINSGKKDDKIVLTASLETDFVTDMVFDHDSLYLAVACKEGVLSYSLAGIVGEINHYPLEMNQVIMITCLLAYKGKLLFMGSMSGKLISFRGHIKKNEFHEHGNQAINCLGIYKGNILISGGEDGRILKWDMDTGKKISKENMNILAKNFVEGH